MQFVHRTLLFSIHAVAYLSVMVILAFRMCDGVRAKCEQVKANSSQAITTTRSLDASSLCIMSQNILLFLASQLECACSCLPGFALWLQLLNALPQAL